MVPRRRARFRRRRIAGRACARCATVDGRRRGVEAVRERPRATCSSSSKAAEAFHKLTVVVLRRKVRHRGRIQRETRRAFLDAAHRQRQRGQSKWEQMGANGSGGWPPCTTKSYMRPRKNSMHHILSHGPPLRIKEMAVTSCSMSARRRRLLAVAFDVSPSPQVVAAPAATPGPQCRIRLATTSPSHRIPLWPAARPEQWKITKAAADIVRSIVQPRHVPAGRLSHPVESRGQAAQQRRKNRPVLSRRTYRVVWQRESPREVVAPCSLMYLEIPFPE